MEKRRRGRPRKPTHETKQGTKNIRMNARTQWVIEFWAMWERKTDTAYIETACEAYADALAKKHGINWLATFNPHPAVRWLRVYLIEGAPLPDDHEARRAFCFRHRDFFYRDGDGRVLVNIENADALWGPCEDKDDPWKQIDAFRKLEGDRWAAGKAMAKALKEANIDPPAWPKGER